MPNCLLVATDDAQKVIRRLDTNGNSTIIAGQVEFDEPDPNDAGTRLAGSWWAEEFNTKRNHCSSPFACTKRETTCGLSIQQHF